MERSSRQFAATKYLSGLSNPIYSCFNGKDFTGDGGAGPFCYEPYKGTLFFMAQHGADTAVCCISIGYLGHGEQTILFVHFQIFYYYLSSFSPSANRTYI